MDSIFLLAITVAFVPVLSVCYQCRTNISKINRYLLVRMSYGGIRHGAFDIRMMRGGLSHQLQVVVALTVARWRGHVVDRSRESQRTITKPLHPQPADKYTSIISQLGMDASVVEFSQRLTRK
ncbi:hypothetical protein BDM02DRAFT_2470514 [Thelephora ganbajun]|uniref:Uncharacterized protein n=1 Tax=Thelephora ganbajun TaxID=370292 RepID=A0ACB6ZF14_THEGA|nr:hypothetical protein BDM02DRAFT_2470514 [Thelephora ganbajun]